MGLWTDVVIKVMCQFTLDDYGYILINCQCVQQSLGRRVRDGDRVSLIIHIFTINVLIAQIYMHKHHVCALVGVS